MTRYLCPSSDDLLQCPFQHLVTIPFPFHIGVTVRILGASKSHKVFIGAVAIHGLFANRAEGPVPDNRALPSGKELPAAHEADEPMLSGIGSSVTIYGH